VNGVGFATKKTGLLGPAVAIILSPLAGSDLIQGRERSEACDSGARVAQQHRHAGHPAVL